MRNYVDVMQKPKLLLVIFCILSRSVTSRWRILQNVSKIEFATLQEDGRKMHFTFIPERSRSIH